MLRWRAAEIRIRVRVLFLLSCDLGSLKVTVYSTRTLVRRVDTQVRFKFVDSHTYGDYLGAR